MLKKLMSLFFEEEEIVEVNSVEEIIEPLVKKPEVKKVEAKKPETGNIAEKEEAVLEVIRVKEKEFVDIKADDFEVAEYKPTVKKIDIDKQKDVEIKPIRRPVKPEAKPYEFSPVISPIFGRSDKDEPVKTVVQSMPMEESKSILGTIISPIYGITKNKNRPAEIKPAATIENFTLEQMLGVEKSENFMQDSFDLIVEEDRPLSKEKPKTLMSLFEEEEEGE
ncbi:MAG: hypothetical protein Q8S15_08715 [Erysipelotrichaceae bacterium]|nr:hypothetical protein [Erysipelotrichaceae bacterium]MDP3306141.1 hypothetical protein [Erysipelotrichaceae bacterium]